MLSKPPDCLGEGLRLRVLSNLDQLLLGVPVINSSDVLLDDRTLVEVGRHEVSCGADEFDSPGMGLGIRVSTLEAWQERVVDVDDLSSKLFAELRAQDLHESCEHDQLDIVVCDKAAQPSLESDLVGFRVDF